MLNIIWVSGLADNRKISSSYVTRSQCLSLRSCFLGEDKMNMKNYSHSEVLRIIIAAANEYHNELEDKNFMIIYYENNQFSF